MGIINSIKMAIVRFFDGLCSRHEDLTAELTFLRGQLIAERRRYDELVEKVTARPVAQEEEPVKNWTPIGGNKSWAIRKAELEKKNRKKIDQLESELGIDQGEQDASQIRETV